MIPRTVKLFLIVVAILFGLTGCIRFSKERVLIATDGYLHTPTGKYRFKTGSDSLRSRMIGIHSTGETSIYAEDDLVLVKLNPMSRDGFLQIFSLHKEKNLYIVLPDSTFQINAGEARVVLRSGKTRSASKPKEAATSLADVDLLRRYLKYSAWRVRDEEFNGVTNIGAKVRYHIPFKVGENDYLIDVETQFRYSRWPEFYVPFYLGH